MTEQEALGAWRRAIAATDEAEVKAQGALHHAEHSLDRRFHEAANFMRFRADGAVRREQEAGRRYLAARDAATARQVTCSEVGPGAADFEGDE